MKIPLRYTLRNFRKRRLTTAITVAGIALVVFVFTAVLMMAYGVQKTLVSTGSPDNIKISRKSAQGEISSIIPGDIHNVILTLPQIAHTADGLPIESGEPVVVINLNKVSGGLSNVTVRGVSLMAFQLRPQVKLVQGRMFNEGARELIVGSSIARRFVGAAIGNQVKFAGDEWTIVGQFDAGGSGFDSEMWGDATQLLLAFHRGNSVSTVTVRLNNTNDALGDFKKEFESDRRLQEFEPEQENKYYARQSEAMSLFINILGIFVTVIFSIGATIGAMITMYAAVANRTVEVGTLRALGFRRRSVMAAFLAESLALALVGGGFGILLASVLEFFRISTLNFGTFAELEFSFSLSPSIIISSLLFAVCMGLIGGFLPSVRAARLNIVNALRAS